MKTTSLLALSFAGLLALVAALPPQEASAEADYAERWGYYGDKTVITGPTNVDEFGMPITKRTGMPNPAETGGSPITGRPSGVNRDGWSGMGGHDEGTASWNSAGSNRPKASGISEGGSGASNQGHHGEH